MGSCKMDHFCFGSIGDVGSVGKVAPCGRKFIWGPYTRLIKALETIEGQRPSAKPTINWFAKRTISFPTAPNPDNPEIPDSKVTEKESFLSNDYFLPQISFSFFAVSVAIAIILSHSGLICGMSFSWVPLALISVRPGRSHALATSCCPSSERR